VCTRRKTKIEMERMHFMPIALPIKCRLGVGRRNSSTARLIPPRLEGFIRVCLLTNTNGETAAVDVKIEKSKSPLVFS
jgi:hypothetical protein